MSSKFIESLKRGMKPTPVEEVKKQAKERVRQHIEEIEMTKRHKYADVIVAWVEGKPIQCKQAGIDGAWDKWHDYVHDFRTTPDFDTGGWLWRIKPEYEWDENTTITLKLPTPEHALYLITALGMSTDSGVASWCSQTAGVDETILAANFRQPHIDVGGELFNKVNELKDFAIKAYKEKHNL